MKSQLLIAAFCIVILAACYEDADPIAEIITEGKGYYPVSANTFIDLTNLGAITNNRIYNSGTNISFELQYWSEDPIQEVNMYVSYGVSLKNKIISKPYADFAAFSKLKSADTLIFVYKMPPVAVKTTVKLDIEIVNQNGLTLTRSITVKDRP